MRTCRAASLLRLTVRNDGSLLAPIELLRGCGDPIADRAVVVAMASCTPLPPLEGPCTAVLVDVPARFSEEEGL
jgi:hypothetical protein